jgi:hypothetical protein
VAQGYWFARPMPAEAFLDFVTMDGGLATRHPAPPGVEAATTAGAPIRLLPKAPVPGRHRRVVGGRLG